MRISIGKAGTKVKITKRERQTLRDAQALCEWLAMQLPRSLEFTPEGLSADNLVKVIGKYCETESTDA